MKLQPIRLDDFYALLFSEELNISTISMKENNTCIINEQ